MTAQFLPRGVMNAGFSIVHSISLAIVDMSTLIKRELFETFRTKNHASTSQLDSRENTEHDIETMNDRNDQRTEITRQQLIGASVLTIVLTLIEDWLRHLVEVKFYYTFLLFESTIILVLVHALGCRKGRSRDHGVVSLQENGNNTLVIILQSLMIVLVGGYWKASTTNSHCPDFYELFLVLTVPSTILWAQCESKRPSSSCNPENIIMAVSGIKLLTLCASPSFSLQVSRSLSCLLLSAVYAAYLSLINVQLKKNDIITVLRWLFIWKIPVVFCLMLINGEFQDGRKIHLIRDLSLLSTLALATALKMIIMFVLMKNTDTLTCLVSMNLAWVPMTLVRAFIFKYPFLVSSFRLLWLIATDYVILFFHAKLKSAADNLYSPMGGFAARLLKKRTNNSYFVE